MLHADIKKAVDSGDIDYLKYTFSTCLDGDPTFDKYLEDYEYCKSKGILFIPHIELHPMSFEAVNEKYWVQLQKDFRENPSIERLEHMRVVARILYRDRIRSAEKAVKQSASAKPTSAGTNPPPSPVQPDTISSTSASQSQIISGKPASGNYQPNTSDEVKIIKTKEAVKQSEPTPTTQSGTRSKKANGVGCFIILACLVIAVIVVVICMNK